MELNAAHLASILAFAFGGAVAQAAITVSVDAQGTQTAISPYIYGRNIGGIKDTTAIVSTDEQDTINRMNEAGIHFLRANTGNNATKYNWRKKITSHPDWYNNVYDHDWDITSKKILDKMPGIDGMYAFQLAGYVAASKDYNFADWDFYQNHNQTWAKQSLNLAGGGVASEDGQSATTEGDYSLYTQAWPADSTVAIIDHWKNDLSYDMSRFQYWSMDNEMDLWGGTHNDLPLTITGDFLVERYVDVAKKARAKWPDIKLTGPVVANEWTWCSINNSRIKASDRDYCWLEYFIKQVAAEQKSSGTRLIDVLDIHWYPTEKDYESQMNWHRVFFDTTYNYPGANSIKQVNGIWDNSITKEFIFKRINDWMDKYFGAGHGITLAVTETDLGLSEDPMTTALIYASFLGTFMDHGVEIFTPWVWDEGMYEVVHLFSRYNQSYSIPSVSSNDSLVSAYSSINKAQDSMTVVFVNRAESAQQSVTFTVENFSPVTATSYKLSGLSGETFVSDSENALVKSDETLIPSNSLNGGAMVSLTLPAKSILSLVLTSDEKTAVKPAVSMLTTKFSALVQGRNLQVSNVTMGDRYVVLDLQGRIMTQGLVKSANVSIAMPSAGDYLIRIGNQAQRVTVK